MSASLRQEFVSEFKAFYKLDKKKSSLKQPDDASSIDSNPVIKGGGVGGDDEKENNTTNNKMKIESSSSPTKSIEYFNNPPGRQKLTMETGGKWTMASNRGPNAILSPAAVTTTAAAATASSDDDNSSTRNNDNVSISRSIRSNGNKSSKSRSQDETLWKEFKHEFAAYYMKKPAIVSLDDSYEIEEQEQEEKEGKESIPRELSFEERYSKMYKLHTQNTGVDVAQQEVAGVVNVQEEEEGDDPALLLQ